MKGRKNLKYKNSKKGQAIVIDLLIASFIFFSVLISYFYMFYSNSKNFDKEFTENEITYSVSNAAGLIVRNLTNDNIKLNISDTALNSFKTLSILQIKEMLKISRDFYLNLSYLNSTQILFKGIIKDSNPIIVKRILLYHNNLVELKFGLYEK